MKFLCFHGGTANSEVSSFHVANCAVIARNMTAHADYWLSSILKRIFVRMLQVSVEQRSKQFSSGHLRQDLEADNTASFYFVDGLFDSVPASELEYQCPPPNLHFFDFDKVPIAAGMDNLVATLELKNMSTPEEAMRKASSTYHLKNPDAVGLMLDYIRNVIEEEGPFQGVVGTSAGATAAATVLMDELQRSSEDGHRTAMRCGIFFVAIPAYRADGKGWILSDETGQRITVPTCHIYSEKDPLVLTSKALWNTCEPSSRTLILHDKGHIIPHEKELMAEVAKFVRGLKQESCPGVGS